MKGLAALGAAALIAGASVLWFMTKPALVVVKREPLRPSVELPVFTRVER